MRGSQPKSAGKRDADSRGSALFRVLFFWMPAPRSDARVWWLLAASAGLWALALAIMPGSGGAALPGLWLPSCPLRSLTGIPCPFCGITTGCAWMVRGRVVEAWNSNILSPLVMAGAAAVALYLAGARIATGRRLVWCFSSRMRRRLQIAVLCLIALAWAAKL